LDEGEAGIPAKPYEGSQTMTEHNLFYYPYASFTNTQLPLLKVAALYFDKLTILDPVGASWDTIGADHVARDAVRQLKDAGILEIVTPATVLTQYQASIAAAIRRDMGDREFLDLCHAHSLATGKQRWTLSLAKVPQNLQTDKMMRHLMGDFAREPLANAESLGSEPESYVSYDESEVGAIIDQHAEFRRLRQSASEVHVFDEYREGYDGDVEYRYADFPLALGEAIMMNHALFAGLLQAGATPISDDPFHSQALALKLERAAQEPAIQQAIADRAARRQLKAGALAGAALTDTEIKLPILNPAMPLAEVLEYRQRNPEALARVRDKLGLMAQRIQAEPWSADFAHEIETQTLPDLIKQLGLAAESRNAWLGTKQWLTAAGITVGAASAVLAVVIAPITPVALAVAGLGLVSGTALPGAEWLIDWRNGKKTSQENGLHYLLRS
jgi:hypothetical protein